METASLRSSLKDRGEPGRQRPKMRPNLERNLFGQHGKLIGKKGANAEGQARVFDAGLPEARVFAQDVDRIGAVAFQFRDACFDFLAVTGHKGPNEIDLARKVMVDARLANAHHVGDVRVAEAVVAPRNHEIASARQDFVGGGQVSHKEDPPLVPGDDLADVLAAVCRQGCLGQIAIHFDHSFLSQITPSVSLSGCPTIGAISLQTCLPAQVDDLGRQADDEKCKQGALSSEKDR